MKALGTILPIVDSCKKADNFADKQKQKRTQDSDRKLIHCERRTVNGEVRYYKTESVYAVAGRNGIKWFETREDGDYALKSEPI